MESESHERLWIRSNDCDVRKAGGLRMKRTEKNDIQIKLHH